MARGAWAAILKVMREVYEERNDDWCEFKAKLYFAHVRKIRFSEWINPQIAMLFGAFLPLYGLFLADVLGLSLM